MFYFYPLNGNENLKDIFKITISQKNVYFIIINLSSF